MKNDMFRILKEFDGHVDNISVHYHEGIFHAYVYTTQEENAAFSCSAASADAVMAAVETYLIQKRRVAILGLVAAIQGEAPKLPKEPRLSLVKK